MSVSRFELAIFDNILSSIAEEMGSTLILSAFSPNIKERKDLSCALFNSGGEMIAQASHIPVHLGSMSFSVEAIVDSEINEGDIFILNDPFSGGTHLPDITCIAPVFIGNSLEFFVASRAHHADIGGKTPGSMPLSGSIHEEGLIIPPSKLYDKGRLNNTLFSRIMNSTRNPVEREGDLTAQIASLNTGRTRLLESVDKYSLQSLKEASQQLLDYSRELIRSVIKRIPDGKYTFEDFLDDDGSGNEMIPLKVDIVIKDEKVSVDFRGSSPQVSGCLNAPLSVTTAAVVYCFQCLASQELPLNSGPLQLLDIIVDEDSILNAKYPAAVVGGNVETSQRVVDLVFGALSKAIPDKIQAASSGTMNNVTFGGHDKVSGSEFAYYETIAGGMGARKGIDGEDAVQTHMTNTLNTPVEAIERELPVRIRSYSVRYGSGGNGRYKGGNGIIREYEFLTDAQVSIITERRKNLPYGISGGEPGKSGRNILYSDSGYTELPPKASFDVQRGNVLRIETPGGGGWGSKDE